ncbi:thiamine pyrophosphate-dependent dehydrogenase E1 component subunit alpha [Dethiosulfatarculus sandiegensis]|uniref:Acetoin:2,6-dichlorophenolindophenol oxidoreductase subunit alpha n=1 Tax=Dethiosulfatarculus sandiegensis TaxID=1429043 RepID=A0A0D2JGP3_9BACT|nr:thiamine pyrophosphate-dependent dehydrogenase E1 component subunit alpha [Dethiosulfatarculus sandiegensis]KIX14911.1 acetoin:2,6-dichlorophenolindophenol oxidoreductase subunit alpha [Dethiosulfatarculus sandiegensis]
MPEDKKTLLDLYRTMVTVRQFETLAGEHFAAGEIPGFIHLSIGQEGSSTGVCSTLRPDDYLTTTHRGHGHMIAKGADLNRMVAELFGKKDGYCKGKGGSMHIADFSLGILGANGVVAGGPPIICGAGLSIKYRKTDQVAVCFFGDGASNRGPVHEAMNMASIWKLPIIFCVESNCWASTTPSTYSCSVPELAVRAKGYGMPGVTVDGNDVLAVREAAAEAVARARAGEGPTFLENKTYRIRGHFEGDPQKYRTQEEVEKRFGENDPIDRFEKLLTKKKILTKKISGEIWDEVKSKLDAALEFAEQSPYPKPEEALEDLYVNP